jgi:type I restriction enzyme, S subunit
VPEHWQVVALKRVIRRLIDCEHKTAPAVDVQTPYRVVRTTAVRNGDLRLDGTYFTSATGYEEWTRRGTPEPGDVIFTREAPAGEACVVPPEESLCLGQRTVLMKLRIKEYDPRFLVHMIYAGPPRVRIQLASQGSTVGHFNMDDIGWMKVLKPPLAEQVAVVEWIAEQTRAQDSAIVRAEAEISLLREYRTRLIADIVSGKLDAREAAAKLPDEAEEEVEELPLADETLDELAEKLDEEGVVA